MKKANAIKWVNDRVKTADIDKTPKNYKIKSELGRERLNYSLNKYGLAGTAVVTRNPKNRKRWVLIDGNSRHDEAVGRKEVWMNVSRPSRDLNPAEFKEMSAMFDFAKAGEVDVEGIEKDLGTHKKFFEAWGLNVPLHLLDNIGRKGMVERGEGKVNPKKQKAIEAVTMSDISLVQLSFTLAQVKAFRDMEVKLVKKWKTGSTMETVLKAMKSAL